MLGERMEISMGLFASLRQVSQTGSFAPQTKASDVPEPRSAAESASRGAQGENICVKMFMWGWRFFCELCFDTWEI